MDPRTAFVLSTAFVLLNGAILGLMHRGLSKAIRPAAIDWRIGTLLAAGGTILLAAQSPASLWLILPAGNAALLIGISLYWRAVRRFDHLPDTPWLFAPALIISLALTWFTVLDPLLWARVVIAAIGWAVAMLCAARSLIQHRRSQREIGRLTLAGILIVLTVFMLFRAFYFALMMRDADSILAPDSLINVLTPLSVAILPVIGTTAFLVMCSERLRTELAIRAAELDQKNIALSQAIRAREDAERIARHDLKTPLASIAATPDLLRACSKPEQEILLCMIENAARRALHMVNLSLDLFRMENGSYVFEAEAVDLTAITRTVISDLQAHAQSKHVQIQFFGGETSLLVAANASLCYSCIANLLKNAIEAASDYSQVVLSLQAAQYASLSIHNDTPVPLALRNCFFEKYATQGKHDGTGLGTYSSQLMATVQGGTLTMQTSDSSGTTLMLELNHFTEQNPAPDTETTVVQTKTNPAPQNDVDFSHIHVLVVDDDAYNRKVLCSQLQAFKITTTTAINGRYAVQAVLAERPDLIFMDIEMPVMGGIEALQCIRELQQARRQPPSVIIAFSSDDGMDSQARFVALGFDHGMSKPTSQTTLRQLLQQTACPRRANQWPAVLLHANLLPDIAAFFTSRLQLIDQLSQASSEKNYELVRGLAHKLCGSLAMYGFSEASDLCKKIEHHPTDQAHTALAVSELLEHFATVSILERDESNSV